MCIILGTFRKKYCYTMLQLWDETMSKLKFSKIRVLGLSLVFTLSQHDTTIGNILCVLNTTTMRVGSISVVNKQKFTFRTSSCKFFILKGVQTVEPGYFSFYDRMSRHHAKLEKSYLK